MAAQGGIYEREFHAAALESASPGADDRAAGSDRGGERGRAAAAERNLRAVATHEQSITESAMVKHHAALRRGLVGISKMVLLCYLALFVALILGLVGIGLVWEWRIESYQEELATVRANIADQQAFVREIEKKSGGVRYRDSSERLYLLMPRGSRAYYNLEEGWVVELPKK